MESIVTAGIEGNCGWLISPRRLIYIALTFDTQKMEGRGYGFLGCLGRWTASSFFFKCIKVMPSLIAGMLMIQFV